MHKYLIILTFTLILALALSGTAFAAEDDTTRVSVATDGTQGNSNSDYSDISDDGASVAFESIATNLVPSDTNGVSDIFVQDSTGTTRVSVSSTGTQANDASYNPSISGDGQYVAFESDATNLVSDDTNGVADIFVHDQITGSTIRVSVSSSGTQADGTSYNPSISADGRYVAFTSEATNLVVDDTNGVADIFVHDLITGTTIRVSVSTSGTQANNASSDASISSDGRYVAFTSEATNLVSDDTNDMSDVFVHDNTTGTTIRVSISSSGTQGNDASIIPSVSADGRYVAFTSYASNLVSDDTNGVSDVFVHDQTTGNTIRVSVATGGAQANNASANSSINGNGRYVAFASNASNLVVGDTNGVADIFIHNLSAGTTIRISVATSGDQSNQWSNIPLISSSGQYTSFSSDATNLVANDTNNSTDVFVHEIAVGGVHPGESIQTAINEASDGDIITVYDNNGSAYTYHETITINKRITLIADGDVTISGDLNPASPVITITTAGNGSTVHGFEITGSTSSAGILLNNTQNNTIMGNNIIDNWNGIEAQTSPNNIISGNTISSNQNNGISLFSSNNNQITNNQINNNQENGIYSLQSNNTISNNNFSGNNLGITMENSPTNTISNNTLINGGISLINSSMCVLRNNIITSSSSGIMNLEVTSDNINDYRQDIDTSNTINGNQIRYIMDADGLNIDSTWNIGYLALIQCQNITVTGITMNSTGIGILLAGTVNSTIGGSLAGQGNTFTNNQIAIELFQSTGNQIINNTMNTNTTGIYVHDNTGNANNTISGNIISTNGIGITLESTTGNLINGNNQIMDNTSYGISLNNAHGNTITTNTIQNNNNYGIYLLNSGNTTANNITGNNITGNSIGITLNTSNNNQINNNQITSNESHGISLNNSQDNIINTNTLQNNADQGIYLLNSGSTIINDNIITGNEMGISLDSSNTNTLNNNQITSNTSYGIRLNQSSNIQITNNNIGNNSSYGIYLLSSSTTNNINGNTITGNRSHGVLISSSNGNTINNNQITSNTSNGMRLSQSSNNQITNNIIQSNSYGLYLLSSSTTNNISGNTITGNTNNGISIYTSNGNIVTGNSITNNTSSGIYSVSSTSTVNYNRIYNNTLYGLNVNSGTSDAQYNWWGTNNPTINQLNHSDIYYQSATVDYTPWLYMTFTTFEPSMLLGSTNNLTANFNNTYDGITVTPFDPLAGHIPDGLTVTFITDLGILSDITTTSNGLATANLTANAAGTAHLSAQLDNQILYQDVDMDKVKNTQSQQVFPTIQQAIDDAETVNGDTLLVVTGTYLENVLVNKDLTIQPVGTVTVQAADPTQSVFTINNTGNGSTIQGFIITGATNAFGVYLNTTNNCLLTGNTINSNFIGLYLQNGSTNTISGNTIQGNGWLGIGVDNSTGNIINGGNEISGNVEGIYLVNNANGNTINGNNIHNNYNAGIIILNGSTGNSISENTAISYNGLIGVLIRESGTNTVSGNTIQGNGWAGVALDNADGNTINGGNVISGNQEGINLTNSSTGNNISGNTITGNSNIGLSIISGSDGNYITSNISISGNGIIGVYLRDSGTNTISGNNIQINTWVGICFDNSTGNMINESNNISGNLEGLYIVNNSNTNTITANNIHENQDTGIYIDGSTGNQINTNTAISGNGVIGVLFRNADGNSIRGNTIAGNTFAGIALDNADSNNINGTNTISGSQMGIYLVNTSNGNTVNNNTLQENTWAGMVLDGATNNTIYQNNFNNNPLQALAQNGSGNSFYQDTTGNYWSDWPSTDPRSIPGSEGLYDQHPSLTPF